MGNLGAWIGIAVGICGLVGAVYWYRASRSSRRNRIAAIWTGIASILTIIGSLVTLPAGQSSQPSGPVFSGNNATIQGGSAAINSGTINNYNSPSPTNGPTPRTFEGGAGIPIDDIEVKGILKPGHSPTPANGCNRPAGKDTIRILIGNNAVEHTGFGLLTAIGIGSCKAIAIERERDGIFVNASLYDPDGGAVVVIRDNKISALNGENYSARQSADESRLIVKNARGAELFYIRFINVQFRGFLGCDGSRVIHVQEGQPVPGVIMSNNCFAGAGAGIQIGPP